MSWFEESERHAKARLGIKTAVPEVRAPPRKTVGEPEEPRVAMVFGEDDMEQPVSGPVSKQKLSGLDNSLQTHVHKLGHLVRRAKKRGVVAPEDIAAMVSEYDQARLRALEYYSAQGSMPYWSGKDWVGKENWQDGGTVKMLLGRVIASKDEAQMRNLEELSRAVNRFVV